MRVLPALLAVSILALLPSALAQDEGGEPGCAQGNPCEVILEVDATGITDLEPAIFGTGDWILFSVYNADDEDHTIRLEGHSLEVTVAAGDIEDTQPIQLGAPGSYSLIDLPSGDEAEITVEENEVFDTGSGTSTGAKDSPIPSPAPALLVAGLALAALAARRK